MFAGYLGHFWSPNKIIGKKINILQTGVTFTNILQTDFW